MITFKSLKWKNFLSTGNTFTELDLESNPSTLIIGDNGSGNGEFTVGATYEILDNISMDVDYVFNENSENLRLAIQIHF